MKRHQSRTLTSAISLAFCASFVAMTGCVDTQAPTTTIGPSSTSDAGKVFLPQGATSSDPWQFVKYDVKKNADYLSVQSAVVSAAKGGSVSAGQFTVIVPAGALSQDTKITVYATSLIEELVAIEPSGLQFRPGYQAQLVFDYRGTDAVNATGVLSRWFNPSNTTWEAMANGVNDTKKKVYVTPLSHFSYYALSRGTQK